MERLLSMYGLVERTRSLELRVAASAVLEVSRAQRFEAERFASSRDAGTGALLAGDQVERRIAAAGCEISEIRLERLADECVDRERMRTGTEAAHRESRLMKERIERVTERARKMVASEHSRKAQAEADDRYASRRGWHLAQDLGKTMNAD